MVVRRRSAFRVWIWVGAFFPWPLRSVPSWADCFLVAFPRGFLVLLQIIGRALVVLSPAPAFLHSGRFEVSYLLMEFQSHSGGSVKDPSLGIMRWRSPWWWFKHRSSGEPIMFSNAIAGQGMDSSKSIHWLCVR
ncbi:BnaCnng32730D [Brassica napus]|nr:unnamed protein product [Brassica napus]CDY58153.1 BnaCnng32730D [Brassica napus]